MNASISVERLHESPAETLAALLADSDAAGVRFVHRLVDEWRTGANRFEQPGEALFVACREREIVGVCGLNVDPYARSDDVPVGRVRHLYVLSAYRRLGIGVRLVTEVMKTARHSFDRLRLRTSNPAAAELYERLGFQRAGDDPHCTHIMELDRDPGGP